ncbi:H/ACA ribonucleoprotein complex non-core subunit NAF1 [Drosophila kikkawai]|uniref:H/ACA ribonucleoprotein complex non-core subunit NAF1 n=1 Tax=Drosophila kikkawai TaxID=30033 RepID=A0A6P4IZ51_DROKI|nr:H/ACA ribonucleoprotein complex non-core subunit NAF1 [Drosophila kikkawai]
MFLSTPRARFNVFVVYFSFFFRIKLFLALNLKPDRDSIMETAQPPAVNATALIEDPRPTIPSTDKVETTPQSDTAVEMEKPKEDKSTNESVSAVQGAQINDASVCENETNSTSVESPKESQQLEQMECDAAEGVGTPAQEQESPMAAAPGAPSKETATENQLNPASKIQIPQVQPAPEAASATGLSLLAAYSSDAEDSDVEEVHTHDSDNEVVEVPVTDPTATSSTAYRRPVVAVCSGSDSSESSSSSDSDSDSEGEYLTVLRKKIDKRINTEECDEEDEDEEEGATGDKSRRRQPPKVRGEMLLDELPPIHQLEITVPEDECVELGKVQSIVDQLVLVSVLPNSQLFDLDTVLFLEKGRKVLGEVFDVLGQVADPLYCVRFNSNQQILDRGIKIGDVVYCAPKTEHTQFVILSKLMQVKGSDASWEHDVEPPARFVDYSDDEEEREARNEQRKRRQRDRTNSTDSVDTVTSVATTATEASSVAAPPPRQRGRRGQRESFRQNQRPQIAQRPDQNQNHGHQQQPMDQQYTYHPSYNPGSWHSNYYHNYHHQPPANFNMQPPQPGMHFPVPNYGYPPMPYAVPPMMPPHMYPPPSSGYGPPPQRHLGPPS